LGGYFAAVAGEEFQVLVELRNEVSGVVACSMLCTFADQGIAARLQALADRVKPEDIGHAWPRGIRRNLNLHSLTLDEALELGFRVIGAGVIEPDECSAQGLLVPHHCMGRISDSMPHLWGAVFPESQASEEEGGAVVEFRRSYDEMFMAGDAYQVVSGIVEVGARVQSFAHLMFNLRTGRCCVNAQAVALRMDLKARKAITMNEAALARLEAQRIQLPNQ
jgi:acyl-CoA thioester hydrolase